jgi:hypothetical protein
LVSDFGQGENVMDENVKKESAEERSALLQSGLGFTWVMWPRFIDKLYLKYKVPPSCMDSIRFLWSACFGPGWPFGTISLSQFPVETRDLRKWISALDMAGIFVCVRASGHGDQKGSEYQFHDASPSKWERFFNWAARVVKAGGLNDHISPDEFGKSFAPLARHDLPRSEPDNSPIVLGDGTPGNQIVVLDPATEQHFARVAAAFAALPLRPNKNSKNKVAKS